MHSDFEFQPPPLDVDAPTFARPQWAHGKALLLQKSLRPVRVISPCTGLNAPERASREMGMDWVSAGDYELNEDLLCVLNIISGHHGRLHVGRSRGDVIMVPLTDLDLSADGLVSGPPCPPFSDCGRRLIEQDCRSSVFFCILLWIIHLSHHGNLTWFVLENVPGILKRKAGQEESFASWVVREMLADLPQGWDIQVQECSSAEFLLPQHRKRVFFRGTAPCLRMTPFQKRVLSLGPQPWPRVSILHFLDHEKSDTDWTNLSLRQQVNTLRQLSDFRDSIVGVAGCASLVGIVDIARDPSRSFDSSPCIDGFRTLRTNCSTLWILPSLELVPVFGERGRFVNRAEKCRAAGLVPSSVACLTEQQVCTAVGKPFQFP